MPGTSPPRTHFVGCGRLGLTLGRLFVHARAIEPVAVWTRSRASAEAACSFIGGGRPAPAPANLGPAGLGPADLVFVLTPDADLEAAALALASSGTPLEGAAVIHASGAVSSEALAPLREHGAAVASIHPIRSFTRAEVADDALVGVVCGVEGDARALARATPIFESAGARLVHIEPEAKPLYHAAAVLACNHLVGLLETSMQAYVAAGMPRDLALAALSPLVRGTVENALARGPEGALSGPIARGEAALVTTHMERLAAVSPELASVYRDLAQQTLPLARRAQTTSSDRLDAVAAALSAPLSAALSSASPSDVGSSVSPSAARPNGVVPVPDED